MGSVELLYSGNLICFIIEEFGNINTVVLLSNRRTLLKNMEASQNLEFLGIIFFYDQYIWFYSEEPIINYC